MSRTQDAEPDRKRVYDRTLNTVRKNTANAYQAPSMAERAIVQTATSAQVDADQVRRALRAAIENGDLFRFERSGQTRYALPAPAIARAVIEREVERDDPDTDVVAACNRVIG